MKISFITTVFNEEAAIKKFLTSLFSQTKLPDEIIIVDGGSSDRTVVKIKDLRVRFKNYKGRFVILVKNGNRSVGRNEAIKQASGDIIVCSDSGNVLDKDWVKNISKPFVNKKVDVVAGYYKGKAETVFQKAVIPFALVMEDKVDPKNFLPATRSIAFKKSIWKKIDGFDEKYSHNEDYVYARKLKDAGANIVFAKDAIVYWQPRKTIKAAFIMMFRFALGDIEAGIVRSKVLLIFARYILALYFLLLTFLYKSIFGVAILISAFLLYIIWSILKNYRYVNKIEAIIFLPLLQFTADAAVIAGSLIGAVKQIIKFNFKLFAANNKFFLFILLLYVLPLLLTIKWGIPNQNHPFPNLMDEWHQLQAVRATAKFGTPNIEGSANGTMLHFLLSAIYLAFFTVLQIINPVVLKVNDLIMRERIFELLRINTILYGIFSLFILNKISRVINLPEKLTLFLFTITPIWLLLSGYFKYDIALIFWILLSILFILRFYKNPSTRNYLLAAVPAGLAFAVKVSAIPLLFIYALSYFLFKPDWKKHIKYFLLGISIYFFCAIVFGMPDALFGSGNILHYFYENVLSGPEVSDNFNLGMNPYHYLYLRHYPVIFGHGLILLFTISTIYWIYIFIKTGIKASIIQYKIELLIWFAFLIFMISLLPLKIYAYANRSLVLLPFFVLICSLTWKRVASNIQVKKLIVVLFLIVIPIQLYETFAFIYIKIAKSPQETSSEWLIKHIPEKQIIGLENIPIYQNIPDITQKEFYFEQYNIKNNNLFKYQIIDSKSRELPSVIVLTNLASDIKIYKDTPKKSLVNRLEHEGYKEAAVFYPDISFYRIYGNDMDYYLSGLVSTPNSITVFRK